MGETAEQITCPAREPEARPVGAIDYDRVRREVTECEGMSDTAIGALAGHIKYWDLSDEERTRNRAIEKTLVAFSCDDKDYRPNDRGREVLAAIDACRVAEPAPDPAIPEGLSDGAICELIRMGARERDGETATYILPAYRDALVGGGLAGETKSSGYYRLNDTGRELAARLVANMRRLGIPEEPEPNWSEPVREMGLLRSEQVTLLLGYGDPGTIATDDSGIGWEGTCTLHGDQLKCQWRPHRGAAAQAMVRDNARNKGRYDPATDRVRLTGLEVGS